MHLNALIPVMLIGSLAIACGVKPTPDKPSQPDSRQAAEAKVQELAAQEVPDMSPEGSSFAGDLGQSESLEQPIQLQPGRCYAVVAVGIGVDELDIQIVINQPPMPPHVAAQDQGAGPHAILGGGGQCFKNPLPAEVPGKVVVKATAGQGTVAAQVYSR